MRKHQIPLFLTFQNKLNTKVPKTILMLYLLFKPHSPVLEVLRCAPKPLRSVEEGWEGGGEVEGREMGQ